MACLEAPKVPLPPPLPSPLSLPLPGADLPPSFDVHLCCNVHTPAPNPLEIPPFNQLPGMPPGPTINLALINVLLGYLAQVNAYIDKLPKFTCPLE